MKDPKEAISRRRFLQGTARGAGLLAVGSSLASSMPLAQAASAGNEPNPFALNVDRLRKTDPKLIHYEQVAQFASPKPEPRRFALGPGDEVYIAAANSVSVLDKKGTRLREIVCPATARCVAVAADGTTYVGVEDHVEVFDHSGKRLAAWDAPAKKAWVTGLALGENEIYAADSGSRVVLRYDKSGKLLGRIAEKNKERNVPGLVLPSPYLDVKLAPDGLLRVNDTGRHRMEAYTTAGDLEFFWGKPSGAIDGFCGCCNPTGFTMLPDGRYVTCEKGVPRVKVYSARGEFESVVAGAESFPENWRKCAIAGCTVGGLDAAVDSRQRIYILDRVTGDVRVMQRKA
jgi:hypothetical protein